MPTDCEQFDEVSNPWTARDYTCMVRESDLSHCAIHCYVCTGDRSAPGVAGSSMYARRWSRPDDYLECRDARGRVPYMRSGDPAADAPGDPQYAGGKVARWMVPNACGQIANCWRQNMILGGPVHEKFQFGPGGPPYSVCDCGGGDNQCPGDPSSPIVLTGMDLATCWVFHNDGWPPGGSGRGVGVTHFDCTGAASSDDPIPIMFRNPGLYNTGFVSLGNGETRYYTHACTANAAVRCWGHVVDDEDSGCAAPGYDVAHYYGANGDTERDAFDYLYVDAMTMAFVGDSPEIGLKNTVLAWIEADRLLGDEHGSVLAFDQLDSGRRGYTRFDDRNAWLPWFQRSFNLDHAMAFDALPTVTRLGGVLRKTGYAVIADYVIVDAELRVNVQLPMINRINPMNVSGTPPERRMDHTYPCVRVELTLHMGLRIDVEGFGVKQLVQTWRPSAERDPAVDLTLENHYINTLAERDNWPVVLAGVAGAPMTGVLIVRDCIAGELLSRADDDTGTIELPPGHGVTTAQRVHVNWSNGERRNMAVTAIDGQEVDIDGGSGDPLPAATSEVDVRIRGLEAGTIRLPTGHGVTTANRLNVSWADGQRIDVTVTAVDGREVAIERGSGDGLPEEGTDLTARIRGLGLVDQTDRIVWYDRGGLPGAVLTRTDDDNAILTVEEGHGLAVDDEVDLRWSGGQRGRVTVTHVAGADVTVEGGTGNELPEVGALLIVQRRVEGELEARAVEPPSQFQWLGHLGFLSDPPARDILNHEQSGSWCCKLAKGWNGAWVGVDNGLQIPAYASHPDDAEETKRIWDGMIRLKFPLEMGGC